MIAFRLTVCGEKELFVQIMIDINLKILIGGFEYRYCQNVFAWCFEIQCP